MAVKKSRDKSRKQNGQMQEKLERLLSKNAELEKGNELLKKELDLLKQIFINNTGKAVIFFYKLLLIYLFQTIICKKI